MVPPVRENDVPFAAAASVPVHPAPAMAVVALVFCRLMVSDVLPPTDMLLDPNDLPAVGAGSSEDGAGTAWKVPVRLFETLPSIPSFAVTVAVQAPAGPAVGIE